MLVMIWVGAVPASFTSVGLGLGVAAGVNFAGGLRGMGILGARLGGSSAPMGEPRVAMFQKGGSIPGPNNTDGKIHLDACR